MRFLVSTNKGLYLLREDGAMEKLLDGSHYGISWNHDEVFLGARTAPFGRVVEWGSGETVPFPEPIRDIHQVYWHGGTLYATNTAANRLDTWDGGNFGVVKWSEGGAEEHVNSIWCDGERFYVCEHRRGVEPARVRVFDKGFDLVDTVELFGLNPLHACGIHNVYVEDGVLYTLSVDKIVLRDLESGGTATVVVSDYLRGFARGEDRFVVGKSEVGKKETRGEGDAEVFFFDEDFRLEKTLTMRGVGQLHDIRILKGDRAHNGIDCPIGTFAEAGD